MCLYFNDESLAKTVKIQKTKKPIIAWKLLRHDRDNKLCSIYYSEYTWIPGKNHCARNRLTTDLTDYEHGLQEINEGLHAYTTREQARKEKDIGEEIWKVEIDPKNLIVLSKFAYKELAATQMKLLCKAK